MEHRAPSPSALAATPYPVLTSSDISGASERGDQRVRPYGRRHGPGALVPAVVCLLCLAGSVARGQEFVPFATLTVTQLDGPPGQALDESRTILVTACGRCENTGTRFSQDRRTVGRNWGTAPVRIETVRGTVVLPEGPWNCRALAPDGTPGQPVPIRYEDGRGVLTLSPEHATMWYLLERRRGDNP